MDVMKLFDEENAETIEFIIDTSVVSVIQMRKFEEYIQKTLKGAPLRERFHALNIAKNIEQVSLRFVKI